MVLTTRRRPRTYWRDYTARLAWDRLRILQNLLPVRAPKLWTDPPERDQGYKLWSIFKNRTHFLLYLLVFVVCFIVNHFVTVFSNSTPSDIHICGHLSSFSGVKSGEASLTEELTSCSDIPSMISETSCSLRAADEVSPPPRCPTRLQKNKHRKRSNLPTTDWK